MKLFKKDALLRMLLSVLDSILVFSIFAVVNYIFNLNIENLKFKYFLFMAIIGCTFNSFVFNIDEKTYKYINASIGVLLSLILSNIYIESFIDKLIIFTVLLFIWSRIVNIMHIELTEAFTLYKFYKSIYILFVANVFNYFLNPLKNTAIIANYTILYIVAGLYLLFKLKNIKYFNANAKKKLSIFELLLTVIIIAAIFILSSTSAMGYFDKYVFENVIKAFIFASTYAGYIIYLIIYKLGIFSHIKIDRFEKITERMKEANNQHMLLQEQPYGGFRGLAFIAETLAIIILAIAVVLIIFYIIKMIRKIQKRQYKDDFTEEREFAIDIINRNISKTVKTAGEKLIKRLNETIRSHMDAKERIRHEYRKFLRYLYDRKILENNNYSSQDIYDAAINKISQSKAVLKEITDFYEDVRYGRHNPTNDEIRIFKAKINDIVKAINNR